MSYDNLVRGDLQDYCPASNLAFNEKIKEMIRNGKTIYHFGFGQAPFPPVEGMVEALRKHAAENAYLDVTGIQELRQAIVDLHTRHDNLQNIDCDNVIVGPGSKELIFLLENVFNGNVIVVSPTWTTYAPQAQLAHHKPHVLWTTFENEWKVTPAAIEKLITEKGLQGNKLLVLCNPDNPTGTAYEAEDLKHINEVCRKYNIIVLCDEIYSRLHFHESHNTLAKYYPEGTILSSGFSKWACAGGWRVGYHIYPPELKSLRDAVRSAASHTYSCAPAPMQRAVAEGLQNQKDCDAFISHTSRIMKAVGEYCHRELTSIKVKCVLPKAGFYCFPCFDVCTQKFHARGITTGAEMCAALLAEAGVALMSGGPAFLRPVAEFSVRLCFVNFDGKDGLEESRRLGLAQPLGEDFVQEYCKPTYAGIQALKSWISKHLDSE